MKDTITILVCNAIRKAEHERNVHGQLTDAQVLGIALKAQMDYHKSESHRMEKHAGLDAQAYKPELKLAGRVTHPADMHDAARKTLGPRYDEFVAIHGDVFTAKQLCDFTEAA